jgi:hypothetical protein
MTINVPEGSSGRNGFYFKMNVPGHPEKVTEIKIDLDSIMNQYQNNNQKFFRHERKGLLNMDSLIANFKSMIPDSTYLIEFQKEMKKFKLQMKDIEKEMKKNNKDVKEKKDPIEI